MHLILLLLFMNIDIFYKIYIKVQFKRSYDWVTFKPYTACSLRLFWKVAIIILFVFHFSQNNLKSLGVDWRYIVHLDVTSISCFKLGSFLLITPFWELDRWYTSCVNCFKYKGKSLKNISRILRQNHKNSQYPESWF